MGNAVARHAASGAVFAPVGSWVAARASSSANQAGRQWIKIQPQGRSTIRLAIRYVNRNADGTFTTPTSAAHGDYKIPSDGGILVEPISDDVTIFLRAVQNGGSSGGVKCIVTEFS